MDDVFLCVCVDATEVALVRQGAILVFAFGGQVRIAADELPEKHGLSMIQFASLWNLSQAPVKCVVPTVIQEAGENAIPIEDKIRDYAATPADFKLSSEEVEAIRKMGDNTGCMMLKGASQRHEGPCERPDEWPMREELLTLAGQYGLTSKW